MSACLTMGAFVCVESVLVGKGWVVGEERGVRIDGFRVSVAMSGQRVTEQQRETRWMERKKEGKDFSFHLYMYDLPSFPSFTLSPTIYFSLSPPQSLTLHPINLSLSLSPTISSSLCCQSLPLFLPCSHYLSPAISFLLSLSFPLLPFASLFDF